MARHRHIHDVGLAPLVLTSTFVAGSVMILLSHPFHVDGFGGIGAEAFAFAEREIGTWVSFVAFAVLFISCVTMNGCRLLVACELLEHSNTFGETLVKCPMWLWHIERAVRYLSFVCAESLLLFAKFKSPIVLVALFCLHLLVVAWDVVVLKICATSLASAERRNALRVAARRWLRVDILLAGATLVLIVVVAMCARMEVTTAAPLMALAIVVFAGASGYAFVVDVIDHWRFFRKRLLDVLAHSFVLAVVFAIVLALCGWHFKAVDHLLHPSPPTHL